MGCSLLRPLVGSATPAVVRAPHKGSAIDRFASFSVGHVHESCWANPMQLTDQVGCKRVGKSVQSPNSPMSHVRFGDLDFA